MLALCVFCIQVNPVELIMIVLLVAFTFQKPLNFNVFFEQFGEKTFEDVEVLFVAQQPFRCPIKADMFLDISHMAYRL